MGTFLIAIKTVLPLFLVIFTGFLFSKTKASSPNWVDILNKYALWIGFPALVIISLQSLDFSDGPVFRLIACNSTYIVCCILLAYPFSALCRLPNLKRRTLFLIFAFGNVSYLGIPLLQNVFGDNILPVAAIISAVYLFWLLTLGIILVEVHGDNNTQPLKIVVGLLKNPLLISIFAGMALVVFNIELPRVIDKSVRLFAESVTAVVLFSLGMFLGFQKKESWRSWLNPAFFVFITMIFFPAIFYLIMKSGDLPADYISASILDAAMPLGLTPYALSQQYKLDAPFAARLVVLATFLSIFILSGWIAVLGI
ncbi:MAG: AEC family transporter [Prolixibacteraceae bacterium]|nr:AEC family transporter [Prolixibacteraceae bacterium]